MLKEGHRGLPYICSAQAELRAAWVHKAEVEKNHVTGLDQVETFDANLKVGGNAFDPDKTCASCI